LYHLQQNLVSGQLSVCLLTIASVVGDPDCFVATCDEENDRCIEAYRTPKSIACTLNLSTAEIVAVGLSTGIIRDLDRLRALVLQHNIILLFGFNVVSQ
jgi:hypothetical protein